MKLHHLDNVLVLTDDIQAGEHNTCGEMEFYFPRSIDMGHKVAARYIEAGEKIIKYGVSIGFATKMIQMGDHVHLHNMKSEVLPKLINTYEN